MNSELHQQPEQPATAEAANSVQPLRPQLPPSLRLEAAKHAPGLIAYSFSMLRAQAALTPGAQVSQQTQRRLVVLLEELVWLGQELALQRGWTEAQMRTALVATANALAAEKHAGELRRGPVV